MYEHIYTLRTLGGLITNTYLLAIIFAIVFVGISYLVSNLIAFEGGKNPKDSKTRKTWFYILGISSTLLFFLWNYLYVYDLIKGAKGKSDFLMHNAIATFVCLIAYIAIGYVIARIFKHSKFGTIF